MAKIPDNSAFPFQIVGFDLDGTLLDTEQDLGAALNHALSLIGRAPVAANSVRNLIGGGARQMLDRALAGSGGSEGLNVKRLHTELIDYYHQHIAVHTRLYPGGLAMLDALAGRGVMLAVVTNKLEALARQLLDEMALSERFYTIIGGDTLGRDRAKPKPDLILEMIARAPCLAVHRAAFVGDTSFDTQAARAARVPCVAVRFGFNDMPADELGADKIIDHYDELIPVLEGL
ncbi:MAG: HAD hydrolase-like protein [Pseudomonadota bacterium]|nr:HAD hydrolase-like protein [Pseudomonadota bacterium]